MVTTFDDHAQLCMGGLPTWAAREGLKVVPVFSIAQATLSKRSATDRKARP